MVSGPSLEKEVLKLSLKAHYAKAAELKSGLLEFNYEPFRGSEKAGLSDSLKEPQPGCLLLLATLRALLRSLLWIPELWRDELRYILNFKNLFERRSF